MEKPVEKEESTKKIFRDYGMAVLGAVLLAFSIRFFFVEAYRMPSRAMRPTIEAGDTLFVAKYPYGIRLPGSNSRLTPGRTPRYGEVVVFTFPEEPGREYIKRVVGLPGDRVRIVKGQLELNGRTQVITHDADDLCGTEQLPEANPYAVCWEPPVLETSDTVTVGPGEVFVVGDLRTQMQDLRKLRPYGKIPFASLRGKASLIWLSIQPSGPQGSGGDWFSRIRFDRMLKGID